MNITTKFKVGDSAFYIDANKAAHGKVIHITIRVSDKTVTVENLIDGGDGSRINRHDGVAFPAKQELLDSL